MIQLYILLALSVLAWGGMMSLAVASDRPRHRAPGLPRVRRSGTTPRRRAARSRLTLAA